MPNVNVRSLELVGFDSPPFDVKATIQVLAGNQEVFLTFLLEGQPSLDKAHENAIRQVYHWGQWVSEWASEALTDLGLPAPNSDDSALR